MLNNTERAYGGAAILAISTAVLWTLNIQHVEIGRADAVAIVNGKSIPQAEYARALDAMQAGLKRPLTADDKNRALAILIDEELLVQQALRLNLAEDDRLVRKNLTQAMINSATVLGGQTEPTEKQLREFFEAERSLFSEPRRVSIAVAQTANDEAAEAFVKMLETGADFEMARQKAGLAHLPVPEGIPLGKTGELLGGAVRDAVNEMNAGDIVGPVISGEKTLFIWMTGSEGGPKPFAQTRDSVRAEWLRRQDEAALGRYMARLRKAAEIKTHKSAIE